MALTALNILLAYFRKINKKTMNKLIKTLMITLLVAGTACTSQAQDEDSKVKVKITKEVDGEKQTFEREYASAEEMRKDKEYREFAGGEDQFVFSFDGSGMHERMIELHEDGGARAFSFSFGDDESSPRNHMRNFQFGKGGSGYVFGDEDAVMDMRAFGFGENEEELEEKMKELEEKLNDLDKDLRKEIMESVEEMQEMTSGIFPRRIKRGGISIQDADDDFGKRGKVEKENKLDSDDMDFIIMNKRLTLRFKIKDAGELTVKISNEAGKNIYNRYFEKFGGAFSDHIDFSNYSEGKYLLEISKDQKRLTKKIVID